MIDAQALEVEQPADPEAAFFHAERLTGIGGSDIGAIVGLDPYRSAFDVFLEKTGQKPPDDLSHIGAVKWGHILEDPVARDFANKTKLKIQRVNKLLRHPYLPYAIAHIDRRILNVREGLEVKTAGFWASRSEDWGEDGSDVIPAQYMCQVQWYMGVTGWGRWHVAALIGGGDDRHYIIERDEEFITHLLARAGAFWEHVQNGTIPPGSATAEEALAKFPESFEKPIEATEEVARMVLTYLEHKATEKAASDAREGLYAKIAEFMGDCDTLTFRNVPIMTWKSRSTGKRLNGKLHETEQPECHAKYLVEGRTRVMLPKAKFTL